MRKSWNFSVYQTESLHSLMERLTARFELGSAALVLTDGKALHVRAAHPADTATLPVAATQFHQYLQLKDGEIAISNDPYAGGTRLSDITLVAGISFEAPAGAASDSAEILLACRIAFPPRIALDGKLDSEGVRIPPMPLVSGGRLNREILGAIALAPNAPAGLLETVERAAERMNEIRVALKALGHDPQSDFRRANFKRYLADSKEAAQRLFHRLPLGETTVTTNLESGELLKLRLEVTDDRIVFDFTGTEPSSKVQLTELATFGACFQTLALVLSLPIPCNAGSLQMIELVTPARTLVNAKAPAATARGVSDGLAAVSALALKAFGKLSPGLRFGASANGSCRVQFEFKDGRHVSDATAGGSGAGRDQAGLDGHSLWLSRETTNLSVEAAERSAPLQIRSVTTRTSSGGKGKSAGGEGLIKTYQVLEPAVLTWALEQVSDRTDGVEGGKAGMAAEILLSRATDPSEKEKLATEGRLELNAGDLVRVHSAGGGGFGEPES